MMTRFRVACPPPGHVSPSFSGSVSVAVILNRPILGSIGRRTQAEQQRKRTRRQDCDRVWEGADPVVKHED